MSFVISFQMIVIYCTNITEICHRDSQLLLKPKVEIWNDIFGDAIFLKQLLNFVLVFLIL